jgi:hypothetical protein
MELMQKFVKEDGAVGLDDLRRWHDSPDAVDFLGAIASATCAAELSKVWRGVAFLSLLILTIVAPAHYPSMAEGITDRSSIFSSGLLPWTLQVYTTSIVMNVLTLIVLCWSCRPHMHVL